MLGLEGLERRGPLRRRRRRVCLRVARANAVRAPQELVGAVSGELDHLAVCPSELYGPLGRRGRGRRRGLGYAVLGEERGVLGLDGRQRGVARGRRRGVSRRGVPLGQRVGAPQELGGAVSGERHGLPVGAHKLEGLGGGLVGGVGRRRVAQAILGVERIKARRGLCGRRAGGQGRGVPRVQRGQAREKLGCALYLGRALGERERGQAILCKDCAGLRAQARLPGGVGGVALREDGREPRLERRGVGVGELGDLGANRAGEADNPGKLVGHLCLGIVGGARWRLPGCAAGRPARHGIIIISRRLRRDLPQVGVLVANVAGVPL